MGTVSYSHLHPDLRPLVDAPVVERIRAVNATRWISYSLATQALMEAEDLLHMPRQDRMPGLMIWGSTNSGKTSIVRHFARQNPPTENPDADAAHFPVLYLELPERPGIRSFYTDVLKALNALYRPTATVEALRDQALRLMEQCQVRVIVIDELHNALTARPSDRERIFVMIRYLGNRLGVPVICSGLGKATLALQHDTQLENRFDTFHLPYWKLDRTFLQFMHDYSKVLPFGDDSKLVKSGLAEKVFGMTDATVGEFVKLLKRASVYAIRSGKSCLDEEAFDSCGYIHPARRRKLVEEAVSKDSASELKALVAAAG